jgi:hypothetical protein
LDDKIYWLTLIEIFIDKEFGIRGDGGFTFNIKDEEIVINGYKPQKSQMEDHLPLTKKSGTQSCQRFKLLLKIQFAS